MPKFEIEVDDKGEFVGTVPNEIDAILKRIEITAHGTGFRSGQGKATEDAKKQIEDAVKSERLKIESSMPAERAKWSEIEEQNKLIKGQYDNSLQEHRKILTAREEAHANEILKRSEAIKVRDQRIRDQVNATLRAQAAQAGARDESLAELEVILQHRIGFDDDMLPFVKAEDGTPAKTTAGNPLPIDVFVKQYLDNHPHHRKPVPGRGGDARGGASLRGGGTVATLDGAKARVDAGDRSLDAINDMFQAGRKKSA